MLCAEPEDEAGAAASGAGAKASAKKKAGGAAAAKAAAAVGAKKEDKGRMGSKQLALMKEALAKRLEEEERARREEEERVRLEQEAIRALEEKVLFSFHLILLCSRSRKHSVLFYLYHYTRRRIRFFLCKLSSGVTFIAAVLAAFRNQRDDETFYSNTDETHLGE